MVPTKKEMEDMVLHIEKELRENNIVFDAIRDDSDPEETWYRFEIQTQEDLRPLRLAIVDDGYISMEFVKKGMIHTITTGYSFQKTKGYYGYEVQIVRDGLNGAVFICLAQYIGNNTWEHTVKCYLRRYEDAKN